MSYSETLEGVDWALLQEQAAIPYWVVDGVPENPVEPDLPPGQGRLWFWGERKNADAVVLVFFRRHWYLLLIKRGDGLGWALPGGGMDPGESVAQAASRELSEETGMKVDEDAWSVGSFRYVHDARNGRGAWMVTAPCQVRLFLEKLPVVKADSDAKEAAWLRADSYEELVAAVAARDGQVFGAHVEMLKEHL